MCQAIRDGGRRCPVHQHQNIAAIKAASHLSGLTRLQTERMFAELRREGRNAEPISNRLRAGSVRRIRNAISGTSVEADVAAELERSAIHDHEIDPASAYANRALITRSIERANNLNQRFQEVADRTGLTKQEVAQKYKEFREAVDTSRGSDVPGEYDQNTRRAAVIANLPYDRASVVALVKIGNLTEAQNERRVTLIPAPAESHINAFGYDEGRLEIEFGSRLGEPYAYQNVPEALWEEIRDSDSPGRIFAREIRNNTDYQYASQAEAERDAVRVRCGACGQFRAASHACPEREVRAELSNTPMTIEQVREALDSSTTDAPEVENAEDSPAAPVADEEVVEQITEAPTATVIPAATEQDAAPAEPIVVPAADMPSQVVDLSTDPDEGYVQTTGFPNQAGVEQVPSLVIPAQTAASQLAPTKFAPENLVVAERKDLSDSPTILHSASLERHEYRASRLSNEDKEIIRNAPDNMYFIIGHERRENGGLTSMKILASYDSQLYTGSTGGYWDNANNGYGYKYTYEIKRRGRKYEDETRTSEQATQDVNAEKATFEALVASGVAENIPSVNSETRRFTVDANASKQPFVKFGNAVSFKRAIRENKVAIVPVSFRASESTSASHIDDQGYGNNIGRNRTVDGFVAVRRNADGMMEVISSRRTLKCSCWDYRNNYHCEHVDYVHRHAGNVAQQIAPSAAAQSADSGSNQRSHRLLTTQLRNRSDVTIVEPEGEAAYVSFGTELASTGRSTAYRHQVFDRLRMPERLQPADPDNVTEDEAIALREYNQTIANMSHFETVNSPSVVRRALGRSDVELPVSARFYTPAHGNVTVTGSMRIGQQTGDLEDVTATTRTLRCTCAQYQEHYDCPHVRVVGDQAFAMVGIGGRTSAMRDTWRVAANRYNQDMRNVQELQAYVSQGMTVEQARERIRAEAERRRIEAEEYAARRAREEAEYAERYARQQREQAERLTRQNAPVIEDTNAYRERMMRRWEEVEEGYSSNPKQFFDDHKDALRRKRNGEDPIPFRTENVTDGICADEPGARQFGIELEFDIKRGVDRREAIEKIGRELYQAGLTQDSRQSGYHTARRNGWSHWSLENDSTVDAELVSPLMKDTPEHWEQLRKVCEIITRNGGVASPRTGSHVHVSTASYGLSTAKHAELLRTVNNNEDVLYRMASNPARGTHRGTQWCAPNASDRAGDVSEEVMDGHNVLGGNSSHMVGLNFEGTANTDFKKSNVEFRMWDGSIDPAVIQQQVAISAAITDHAERKVVKDKISRSGAATDRVRIGTGKRKEQAALTAAGTQTHTEETFKESTEQAAQFFDKIFRRREDRAAAASLFAVTNWN